MSICTPSTSLRQTHTDLTDKRSAAKTLGRALLACFAQDFRPVHRQPLNEGSRSHQRALLKTNCRQATDANLKKTKNGLRAKTTSARESSSQPLRCHDSAPAAQRK